MHLPETIQYTPKLLLLKIAMTAPEETCINIQDFLADLINEFDENAQKLLNLPGFPDMVDWEEAGKSVNLKKAFEEIREVIDRNLNNTDHFTLSEITELQGNIEALYNFANSTKIEECKKIVEILEYYREAITEAMQKPYDPKPELGYREDTKIYFLIEDLNHIGESAIIDDGEGGSDGSDAPGDTEEADEEQPASESCGSDTETDEDQPASKRSGSDTEPDEEQPASKIQRI